MTITVPGRYRRSSNVPARRGDPLAEFEQLQEQMGQMINSFLRGEQNFGGASQAPFWVPAADLEETDDAYGRPGGADARENPRWGYVRIVGECRKLGVQVSAMSVRRIPRRHRIKPAPRRGGPSWTAFLRAVLGFPGAAPYRPGAKRLGMFAEVQDLHNGLDHGGHDLTAFQGTTNCPQPRSAARSRV